MIGPDEHIKESERLNDLESFSILDTLPESDYDNLTRLASQICNTPISLISLIDDKRQWFKSHHGLYASETPKEQAFCAHAINNQEQVFIIEDARKDIRFHDNPLVTGDPYVIFYAGVPLISEGGLPLGTLCVIDNKPKTLSQDQIHSLNALSKQVMNLLKLRKSEKLLEQSLKTLKAKNKELEQFTFIASHDLQEPINTVISLIDILEEEPNNNLNAIEKKSFEYIYSAAHRMKALVKALLDYGKLGERAQVKQVDCDTVVENVIKDLDALIKQSNAQITINKLPVVYAFEVELMLLFKYLIINAIKFSKPNVTPVIKISFIAENLNWKFSVEDNGIGIDEKYKEKIFLIFQRLHQRVTYSGIGIGLSHCNKIAELHKGNIWVDSKLNHGSSFQFTINKNLKHYEKI